MLPLVHRLLGMNARELRRSLPLFVYLFLTMAGSVASKAARDALFLERFRAVDLPYADIAIALIVVLTIKANPFVLEEGGGSIAGMIAVKFAEADGTEVSGLIAAGFALFVVTLLVNLGARRIVNRSRLT